MTGIGTGVNGGFAEYCTVNAKQAYKLPDDLSFEAAMPQGDTVMIIGVGTIGMIMLQLAKTAGAATLILMEPIGQKREMVKKLGADITINPMNEDLDKMLEENGNKQIDKVIECVGLVDTMKTAIRYTGKGGTTMLFGLTDPDSEIPIKPFEIFKNEIIVKASFVNPYTQMRAVKLLASKAIDVASLITDIVSLENINNVFMTDKYKNSGKY